MGVAAVPTSGVDASGADAFRQLFESLPVGAVLFDLEGDGFLAFNAAARAQLGYDADAVARLRLADVDAGSAADVEAHLARRRALRPGEPPRRFATLQRAADGGLRHVDVTAQCIELDGHPTGYAVWIDVTERERTAERLRQREAELARVLRIGQLGGFEIDLSGGRFANRRFPEYLDLHGLPAEATDEPHEAWVRRLHPDDREEAERVFLEAVRGTTARYHNEYRVCGTDGSVRWIRAAGEIERGPGGEPRRMVGAHLDITDLKRAESAAAEQARRLLEADARKDEFLAVLSHELRNPLAALTNALALLSRPDVPTGAPAAMLEISRRQVRQLTRLVDDLLEVSRISSGRILLRRERLRIADVVREGIDSVGSVLVARDQSLSLTVQEPASAWVEVLVDADRARLVQVVENLLGNASKYSDEGGAIRVRLGLEERCVTIEVEDDGAGIPVDALEEVFALFAQVDAQRDRSRGGLGIGLALVRRLVALHGGSVVAHSDGPDRGARFTVTLPRAS